MSTFTDYRDHLKSSDVPVLGSLIWYSVPEATIVEHGQLEAILTKQGLDEYVPRVPKDKDVFKRCATAGTRKNVPTDDPEVRLNFLVRDVNTIGDRAWKHVVVEQRDAANNKLGYSPAVELMFNGEGGEGKAEVSLNMLAGFDQHTSGPEAEEIAKGIVKCFEDTRGHVNAYGIRDLIRKVLAGARSTTVRPAGGVYFVMESERIMVEALERVADSAGCEVHSLPLIDDGKQREMLRKAFEAETIDEIDVTMDEINKLLSGPPISQRKFNALMKKMGTVREKTSEYQDLLDTQVDNTEFRLQMYERAMKRLLEHVEIS